MVRRNEILSFCTLICGMEKFSMETSQFTFFLKTRHSIECVSIWLLQSVWWYETHTFSNFLNSQNFRIFCSSHFLFSQLPSESRDVLDSKKEEIEKTRNNTSQINQHEIKARDRSCKIIILSFVFLPWNSNQSPRVELCNRNIVCCIVCCVMCVVCCCMLCVVCWTYLNTKS